MKSRDCDHASLEAHVHFCGDAARRKLGHILGVFNPNASVFPKIPFNGRLGFVKALGARA